jgi:hypothetical protein
MNYLAKINSFTQKVGVVIQWFGGIFKWLQKLLVLELLVIKQQSM